MWPHFIIDYNIINAIKAYFETKNFVQTHILLAKLLLGVASRHLFHSHGVNISRSIESQYVELLYQHNLDEVGNYMEVDYILLRFLTSFRFL